MRTDFRWLVALAGNAILLWVVGQANHHLTLLSLGFGRGPVHLFVLGLPVAFAALRFNLRQALVTVVPTTLAAEAGLPVPPGLLMITGAACVCATIALRGNFNRFESTSAVLTALVVNVAFVIVLTIALPPAGGPAAALRLSVDLLLSQVAVIALCGWFFAWQLALLRLFGFDLETELRDSP